MGEASRSEVAMIASGFCDHRRRGSEARGPRPCRMVYGEALHMGSLHTRCRIANPSRRTKSAAIPKILVDTGSEYTWVPAPMLDFNAEPAEHAELPARPGAGADGPVRNARYAGRSRSP